MNPGFEDYASVSDAISPSPQRAMSPVQMFCDLEYTALGGRPPHISYLEGVCFESADVYRYQSRDMRSAIRSQSHIRRDGVDDFIIIVPLLASLSISQCRHTTRIDPGSFAVITTAQPFEAVPDEHPTGAYSELAVRISGALLRQQVPHVDACCNHAVQIRPGPGRIMRALLDLVLENGRAIDKDSAERLSALLIDAVAAAALDAPELRDARVRLYRSAHDHIRATAIDHVRRRLADPMLNATTIAKHCNVSTRYLHASFAAASTTVGTVIRELRLQQCKAELSALPPRQRSITQLAMKWGFNSSSGFSRAYRERFGNSPSEEASLAATLGEGPRSIEDLQA